VPAIGRNGRFVYALLVARIEREGFVEPIDEVRPAVQKLVVHRDRRHDATRTAAPRGPQAQEADASARSQ
jgi:hypothetical protein